MSTYDSKGRMIGAGLVLIPAPAVTPPGHCMPWAENEIFPCGYGCGRLAHPDTDVFMYNGDLWHHGCWIASGLWEESEDQSNGIPSIQQ